MTTMLLEWVFTSTFLILTVLALRAAFGKRVSARLRYALWAVVLVRLLVPVQLFTSPIAGTLVFFETRTEQNIYKVTNEGLEKGGPDDVLALGVPDGPSVLLTNAPIVPVHGAPDAPVLPAAPEPPAAPDLTKAPQWLGWIWLGGSAAVFLVLLLSNLRFFVRLRRCRIPLEGADCPLRVYAAVGLPSPCLFGLVRPAVYVGPETAADPDMLRHVLAHEYTHYRQGDHIWSLLRCAALAVHWWNPLVWLAVVLSRRDGELACDEGALKRLGEDERLAYGNTLLALVTAKPSPVDLLCCATTMAGEKRSLKERVSRIACAPKRWLWAAVAVVLATALACVCAFGSAAEEPEDGPEPDPAPSATAGQNAEVEVAFRNDVPADVLAAAKAYAAERFQADVPDGWVEEWGSSYDEEKGEWVPVPLQNPVESDRVRIKSMTDVGPETVYGVESVEVELWHFTYEYHTTMPERAQTLLAGGMTLDENGWMRFGGGCNYLAVTAGEGGTKITPFFSQAERIAVGFRNDLMDALQEIVETATRYKNADSLYDANGLLRTFDLNRNGVEEYIQICDIQYVGQTQPSGRRVEVWEDDRLIWQDEGYYTHAGYNAVFLCTLDGKEYLLRYNPYMAQGWSGYSYKLFTLTPDGQEEVVRENSIDFCINLDGLNYDGSFDPDAIAAFMDEINDLLAHSVQLINTDGGLLDTFQEEGRLYDRLSWLDLWEPVFARDPSKSMLENLRAYQAAMEGLAARQGDPYLAVIQGERELYSPEHGGWMTLDEFCAKTGPGYTRASFSDFSVLDLDGDGAQEVVLATGDSRQWCIVLHEQHGAVRGYAFYIRWLNTLTLKEDGAFHWSSGAFENGWGKLRFTEDGYETERTIWHIDTTHYLGNQAVSQVEYDAADDRQNAVPDAVWEDFTEGNVKGALMWG